MSGELNYLYETFSDDCFSSPNVISLAQKLLLYSQQYCTSLETRRSIFDPYESQV